MQVKILVLLYQYITFCYHYDFINAKPMIGQNVRNAAANEFPFVASMIRFENPNRTYMNIEHVCTGSLITRTDVAIAAHCINDEARVAIRIVVGSIDYRRGRRHNILWWLTFDQWSNRNHRPLEFQGNDVANIRLIVRVSDAIVPVRIASIRNRQLYGEQATVAGWGAPENISLSSIMKTANFNILSNRDCMTMLARLSRRRVPINERQYLCAVANPYVILNEGDSGGPLLFRNELIGIVTASVPNTLGNCHPDLINLNSAIEYYKRFLFDVMNRQNT